MGVTIKNLVKTPTFESGSVGGWTVTGGTLSVVTGHSAFGTKSLKVTSTGTGTVLITAPSSPVLNSAGYTAPAAGAAYFSRDAGNLYTSDTMYLGANFLNSGGGLVQQVFNSFTNVTSSTTPTRGISSYLSSFSPGVTSIQPVIKWTPNATGNSVYIDGVTLVQFYQGAYAYETWANANVVPDIIGSMAASGNVTYSWQGTVEDSYSLATSSAAVSLPSTLTRGTSATITGTGFTAGSTVKLRLANDADGGGSGIAGFATVTADGSGAFSYNWTVVGDQGTRWVAAQITSGAGWGAMSSALTVKGAPAGTPLKNYAINPAFRSSNGTARNLFNICPNPTPTVDLTGWDAVGSATVTRSTAAKIVGISHGARVVSAASTDGIALPHAPVSAGNWESPGYSAYVRAVTSCTLKITGLPVGGSFTVSTSNVGWGEAGWGPEISYTDGDTITLTAGQVTRARMSTGAAWPYPAYDNTVRMSITGTGTYDVDGVWEGIGVDDGEYPDGSGGFVYPSGTAPFFCGGTPADDDFTYEWIGTPYASASARRGRTATGVLAVEGWGPTDNEALGTGTQDYNYSHQSTRSGGETVLALRAKQWFSYEDPMLANAAGATTTADLGLTIGKSYLLSMDVIMDYSAIVSGYALDGHNGNEFWIYFQDSTANSAQPKIAIPGRVRVHAPFNVDTGGEKILLESTSLGWLLGEVQLSKLAITETTIYSLGDNWTSPVVLTDTGIVAGSEIMATLYANGPSVDTPVALEALVSGVWTEIGSVTIGADDWEMTNQFTATVPVGATGVRLTSSDPSATYGYAITDAPPPYFDGSMADADGWAYSWEGTADASPSLRSEGPTGPEAQVFVAGSTAGVTVSEMRVVVSGGSLVPITEAG